MRRWGARRLFRFSGRTPAEISSEVAEEFHLHLEMRVEALTSAGLLPADARAQALREFGDVQQAVKVALHHQGRLERRMRLSQCVDELQQDLRHAWRSLQRAPGAALTSAVILGVGIGMSSAAFSAVNGVLFPSFLMQTLSG